MYFNNTISKVFNNDDEYFELTDEFENEEVLIDSDALKLDFNVMQGGVSEMYYLYIPMTQGNRGILKKTLSQTGNTIEKETDDRGRLNLGTQYADQEVEVIVLD